MYNGIGLTTPRGSGTNGYVTRNLSFVKPPPQRKDELKEESGPKLKKANAAILEHNRKRQVEVKCMELRIKLEDEGVDDEEIETRVEELREKLLQESQPIDAKKLKEHDVHELAAAKEKELEKMRRALRIKEDRADGAAFR
ncbi:RNA-splicing factor [Rhizopus azygosporus]|uniref:RNA-splicing factor n=1 Tax=Rhizopus azygosporus TaxID=86630 RepID=A0A367KDU3_RHIAZ|nr:RNA-splicing factor [Rhizopus azygosporus]CEG72047.1 hypothetical protein RMATCC62417_07672 [Rhizopus microsporus]